MKRPCFVWRGCLNWPIVADLESFRLVFPKADWQHMNLNHLNWFTRSDGLPELLHDLRTGRAGCPLRLALSIAAAGAILAFMLGVTGLIAAANRPITDEFAFGSAALPVAAWCGSLAWLWSGYRHWHRTLRTTFGIMAMWAAIIMVCFAIEAATRNSEFLISAFIVLGLALTVAIVATVAYRSRGGRRLHDGAGAIAVHCPDCGYSMVGLESCQCPECGHRSTIDSLIAAQDYEAHRSPHVLIKPRPISVQNCDDGKLAVKALPHGST